MKKIFLKTEWAGLFAGLDDKTAGMLVKSIFSYNNGEEPEFDDPILSAVFKMIKTVIDENQEAYEETCRKNAETGRKGGLKRAQANASDRLENEATASETKRNQANQANIREGNIREDIKENTPNGVSKKSSRFSAPTVEQVQEYITEKGYQVDAERFVDFYASKGWKVGSSPMKDWRAAVRNWARERRTEKPPNKNKFNNFDGRKYTADDYLNLERTVAGVENIL